MSPTPPTLLRATAVLLAALCGCKITERPVSLQSDPPGANILVDGEETGFVTPALLRLDRKRQTVRLELPGYVAEERELIPGKRRGTLYWREMSVSYRTWNFPLWLNRDDVFTPYKVDKSLMPNRLFVRMRREADVRSASRDETLAR